MGNALIVIHNQHKLKIKLHKNQIPYELTELSAEFRKDCEK